MFTAGVLKSAVVQPVDPLLGGVGYYLVLTDTKKQAHIIESRRSHEPRAFKSLDAACSAAREVGFREKQLNTDKKLCKPCSDVLDKN